MALGRDIPVGVTRAIRCEGVELVGWRSESGTVQVWEDRCPHRGMRLSYGFVRGERLACLYHGWEYATSGSCQRIPAHSDLSVPPSIRVNGLVTREQGGLVFVAGAEETPPPSIPAVLPLASLHLTADAQTLRAIAPGATEGPLLLTRHYGTPLYLGWHAPGPDELMVHALIAPDTSPAAALVSLRALRAAAELRPAA